MGVGVGTNAAQAAAAPAGPSNIIDNGTFASAAGWTTDTGAITGGQAVGAGTYSRTATTAVVAGGYYKITFDWSPTEGGDITLSVGGGAARNVVPGGAGSVVLYVIAGATQSVSFTLGGNDAVDNLVVAPVTATLGTEIVQDGGFDDASKWSAGTGWDVSGGTGNATSAATNRILMNIPSSAPVIGTYYLIVTTITSSTAGGINMFVGGASPGVVRNAAGTYSALVQAVSTGSPFFRTSGTTTLSVDNFSVKPLTFSV